MPGISDLSQAANYVELDWYDGSEVVHVRPRDKQRFAVQKDRAIEILHAARDVDRFHSQFQLLLNTLVTWARKWQESLFAAILTLQDDGLGFVLVQKTEKYDEDLQDDLSDLDVRIANDPDFDLLQLKTLLLPHVTGDSLDSFLDKRLLLLVYFDGERDGSHRTSEPKS